MAKKTKSGLVAVVTYQGKTSGQKSTLQFQVSTEGEALRVAKRSQPDNHVTVSVTVSTFSLSSEGVLTKSNAKEVFA